MPIKKAGRELSTLEDWERWAGPKSADQWVDGRSAKEAARAWLQTPNEDLPTEIVEILASHPAFTPVREWFAEPEVQLRFCQFAGEPRTVT
jgi:hypothetical protein